MTAGIRRVAVIGGVRIPFCRSNTLYADLTNLDMQTAVLDGLADKYDLEGVHIDEAVGGAVVTHSKDWNIAREAVIRSKLAPSTPGITMIQACGTSLQAAMVRQLLLRNVNKQLLRVGVNEESCNCRRNVRG